MKQQDWHDANPLEPGDPWETRLRQIAGAFPYPPTPSIRALTTPPGPRRPWRRLAWAVAAILLVVAGLLAVPQVRAAVAEFLQLGAIRIFQTPSPATVFPAEEKNPTPVTSLLDLAGETSLAEARERLTFPLRLPTYPPDLGPPDRVFRQDLGGPVVVLAWLDPEQPERVQLSLHQLSPGTFAEKGDPGHIQETIVNGRPAYWTEGPYLLQFRRGNETQFDLRRLVQGHVLLWTEGEITYRLETDLPLNEAIKIAESLR